MRDLRGKSVLLTGAAAGIGRELAIQLAEQGCRLLLLDHNEAGLRELVQELETHGTDVRCYVCDLTDFAQLDEVVECVQQETDVIDVLINNAGVAWYGPTHQMTQAQWDWLMAVNLQAPIRLTQHLLPHLLTRPEAHIVNMCSVSGLVAGGRFAAYHVSKFGLVGFTEALRAEYGRTGIGVSAICPGPVRTDLYQSAQTPAEGRAVPHPPRWVCATPERVARLTIRAIRRNRRMVLITPMAHGLFQLKRFLPGLLDFASRFSRSSRKRRRRRFEREAARLAALRTSEQEADDSGETRAA